MTEQEDVADVVSKLATSAAELLAGQVEQARAIYDLTEQFCEAATKITGVLVTIPDHLLRP